MLLKRGRRRAVEIAHSPTVVYALRRYVVAGLLVLITVSGASVYIARGLAADIALGDASTRGAAFAHNAVAPLVDRQLREGSPAAQARLATLVNSYIQDGSIIHFKLWDPTGRIVWSDETTLIGQRFDLEEDVADVFGTSGVTANVSDLDKTENAQELPAGRLLEVYAGMTDTEGRPMVFESYWSTELMDADAQTILVRMTGFIVGAMVLLFLALLPLAVTLAGRVDRAHAQRTAFQHQAMAAADLERKRVVEELHDGLIQDLSSLGYVIPTLLDGLPRDAEPARTLLSSIGGQLHDHIASLRDLIRDVYPPDLEADGLESALQGLARKAQESGVVVDVSVSPQLETLAEASALVHRIVRESLINVVRHAEATTASVTAEVEHDVVRVRVCDDGIGLGDTLPGEGHLGLRLITDAVRAVRGRLTVGPAPGGGTVVEASFPAQSAPVGARG